jgi:hypothetical protein
VTATTGSAAGLAGFAAGQTACAGSLTVAYDDFGGKTRFLRLNGTFPSAIGALDALEALVAGRAGSPLPAATGLAPGSYCGPEIFTAAPW